MKKAVKSFALLLSLAMLVAATCVPVLAGGTNLDPYFSYGIDQPDSIWSSFGKSCEATLSTNTPNGATGYSVKLHAAQGTAGGVKMQYSIKQSGVYTLTYYLRASAEDSYIRGYVAVDGRNRDKPINPFGTWGEYTSMFHISQGDHEISLNVMNQLGNDSVYFYNPRLSLYRAD